MIKNIIFRTIRYKFKKNLPAINMKLYRKMFTLSYKFFVFLKPSQIWVIILALLNKTDLKNLISIPSMFILFNSIISDSSGLSSPSLNVKTLFVRLEAQKLTHPDNNLENFFWIVITLAVIKRFTVSLFKLLWIPFKIAFIFYILKYFGYDFSYIFNFLNNISLGIIDWFHNKIINFFNLFNNNNENNN